MKKINSRQNDTIKRIKSLERKKFREKYGEMVLEGQRLIMDAMKSGIAIKMVLCIASDDGKNEEIAGKLAAEGAEVIEADKGVFEYVSDTVNSQGILAVAEMPVHSIETVMQKPPEFMIYLDCLQDPGNLGTVIRTADAAGAGCVALSKGSVDASNPKTLRSAMGSMFHLPVVQKVAGESFIEYLKTRGYRIVAADIRGASSFVDMDYDGKTCLVIGNEGSGIRDEILDICDESVKIPIIGRAESLNAAVAAGILLYDISMKKNC